MNKGFTLFELIVVVAAMCIVGVFTYSIGMYKLDKNAPAIGDTNCEHEFVISSKYDWWFEEYKTISKCTKCGKEI